MADTEKSNKNSLKNLSTEQLVKRRDLLKGVLIGFIIVWLFVFGMAIYFYINKSTAKLFIPLAAMPATLLIIFLQIVTLNKEIKLRPVK